LFWGVAYFAWDFLVQHIEFSSRTFIQGILNGPYTQFWYIYVLVGLYLLTPILRKFVGQLDETLMKYFLILWFLGAAILPFLEMLTNFQLNSNVFTITGYIGYFVLGAYLVTVRMRRSTISILMILGITLTAVGTYVLAATVGGTTMYFFQQYLSPTIILASVMMFLMLLTFKPPSIQKEVSLSKFNKIAVTHNLRAVDGVPVVVDAVEESMTRTKAALMRALRERVNKLIRVISENTFPIFLLHVMIIESIQKGYFGFVINRDTLKPIIEVPLLTAIVFFACLGIVLLLKKVPYMNKLIG
jgi:surface polysaccharide O-acyltransferase-like enzyme